MADLFYNKLPDELAREMAQAKAIGVKPKTLNRIADVDSEFAVVANAGTLKWVITEQGELVVVVKWIGTTEIAHSVLTEGKPVQAAGEAEISSLSGQFYGISITNYSGHYQPDEASVELGKASFEKLGIRFL